MTVLAPGCSQSRKHGIRSCSAAWTHLLKLGGGVGDFLVVDGVLEAAALAVHLLEARQLLPVLLQLCQLALQLLHLCPAQHPA